MALSYFEPGPGGAVLKAGRFTVTKLAAPEWGSASATLAALDEARRVCDARNVVGARLATAFARARVLRALREARHAAQRAAALQAEVRAPSGGGGRGGASDGALDSMELSAGDRR